MRWAPGSAWLPHNLWNQCQLCKLVLLRKAAQSLVRRTSAVDGLRASHAPEEQPVEKAQLAPRQPRFPRMGRSPQNEDDVCVESVAPQGDAAHGKSTTLPERAQAGAADTAAGQGECSERLAVTLPTAARTPISCTGSIAPGNDSECSPTFIQTPLG